MLGASEPKDHRLVAFSRLALGVAMNDDNKTDDVTRFYVENPEWTYGKKLVVLATDYDKLAAEHTVLKRRVALLEEQKAEWERAARIARERNAGRITVVK